MAGKTEKTAKFVPLLRAVLRIPGVAVDREEFLRRELGESCPRETVDEAVAFNPAKAGVSKELINKLSADVVSYETINATSLSALVSLPGGPWALGAAAADMVSYFAFVLRAVQELAYLCGFGQFEIEENSETVEQLMLFVGTMFDVQGASVALELAADVLADRMVKQAAERSLLLPLITRIGEAIGTHVTRHMLADTLASAVPLLGGALSGGLTYLLFKPGCVKLREQLMSYDLCDPEYYRAAPAGETEEGDPPEEAAAPAPTADPE